MLLQVAVEQGNLRSGEDKRGEAREKDRDAIEALDTDCSSWVRAMPSCKSSWEEGEDSFSVSTQSSRNGGTIARNTPDNSNVFSRF